MSILDWFKPAPAGAPPEADAGSRGGELGGLNFMAAINVHMRWRTRLESHIHGTDENDLPIERVARDDACQLGQWIYGDGARQYGGLATFAEMKLQHAHFHACAGQVLAMAKAGRKAEALGMLTQGDYLRASERVKMLLAKLYVEIAERGP
jgi:arginine utilization protein RocB